VIIADIDNIGIGALDRLFNVKDNNYMSKIDYLICSSSSSSSSSSVDRWTQIVDLYVLVQNNFQPQIQLDRINLSVVNSTLLW